MTRKTSNDKGKRTGPAGRSGAAAFRGKKPAKPGAHHRPKAASKAAPHPAVVSKGAQRIAKVIARAGLASRREAEQWIAAGRVAVNGAVIASPALNVTGADQIVVDGAPLPARERTRLFLYHKPRGLVTTNTDPEGRPTIFAALPKHLPRLISIGRLDLTTEGLLLLTNDGGLARVLELPQTGWLRRYRVRAHGSVTQDALDKLRDGIEVEGIRYGSIEATLDRLQGANTWLTFAIREGKNREIRNVLGALGLQVNRLIRVSFGPFQLGELAEGAVEEIKTRTLRDQLGERIAALAGADFAAPLHERESVETNISAPDIREQERPVTFEQRRDRPPRHGEHRVDHNGGTQSSHEQKSKSGRETRFDTSHRRNHVWRSSDGSRPHRDPDASFKRRREKKSSHGAQRPDSDRVKRAGLLTDHSGRRVLVERIHPGAPVKTAEPVVKKHKSASRKGRPFNPRPPGRRGR